jgi:hypothetical protein
MADERNLVVGISIILLIISSLFFGFKSYRASQTDGTVLSVMILLGLSYTVFVVFTQNPYQREPENFNKPKTKSVIPKSKVQLFHNSVFQDEATRQNKTIKISSGNLYINNELKFSGLKDGFKLHVVHHKSLHSVVELDNVDYVHSII